MKQNKVRKYLLVGASIGLLGIGGTIGVGRLAAQSTDGVNPTSLPGYLSYMMGWSPGGSTWNRVITSGAGLLVQSNAAAGTTVQSLTITTGGSFQTVLTQNFARKSCQIVNKSTDVLYVSLGTASVTQSVVLTPSSGSGNTLVDGKTFDCSTMATYPTSNAVQVMGATTGDAFLVMSQ